MENHDRAVAGCNNRTVRKSNPLSAMLIKEPLAVCPIVRLILTPRSA